MSTDDSPATKLFLNVCKARSAAFLLCLCSGYSYTTVLLLWNIHFIADATSLSIMFNFGACPTFSNVLCKMTYVRIMSLSLLVFMRNTKIVCV